MTSSNPRSGHIVVGVDGSPSGEHAVLWAADEAHLQHLPLTLVHTQRSVPATELAWLSTAGISPRRVDAESQAAAERVLQRASSLAADRHPDLPLETVTGYGDARRQLLEMGHSAAMVVVGTRGHGPVVGLLLGSVSAALVRHSDVPVAVVRPPEPEAQGLVIAADGSEASLPVVEQAFREASSRNLSLTVAHCLWDGLLAQARWVAVSSSDPYGEKAYRQISESIAGMADKFPDVPLDIKIARGAIDAFVVDMSQRYELLVIGRPPLSLGQRLTLSGLTTSIAEHAHSPVLVVP
jgi:nucleotide-binding universal stress UspA family protein